MNLSRRFWFRLAGLGALAPLGLGVRRALAQDHAGHLMPPATTPGASPGEAAATPVRPSADGRYTPVRTLNGWTLPHRMVDGVKEFHLVAEEIEHEFAPGSRAKCWGYNGTTPGPTIEAVEGDRVRILVTNRLPEHTTIHWHGILLPSGMDGVGGGATTTGGGTGMGLGAGLGPHAASAPIRTTQPSPLPDIRIVTSRSRFAAFCA